MKLDRLLSVIKVIPVKLITLLLIGLLITMMLTFNKAQDSSIDKRRADLLAEAYSNLKQRVSYKSIEIGKPITLYDGTKFTINDIQVFQPSYIARSGRDDVHKYIAIAVDIEINKEIDKIYEYNPEYPKSKSIQIYTSKDEIDNYFAENIIAPPGPHNPHSMKWAMEELEHELRLVFRDQLISRFDPYYIRLAFDKESAQPRIFRLWNDYEKRRDIGKSYIDAPRKLRGWVTWIFRVNEAFIDDKIDNTFAEGLGIKYKNSGGNIEQFLKELGKSER